MERKHPTADIGVVIGRFQVANLHPGHKELLDWVAKEHKKVIVVLGVSPVFGRRSNPLDFATRVQMISKAYPEFMFAAQEDCKTDEQWSSNLDTLIRPYLLPRQTVCLYGARDSFLDHYKGRLPTQELVGDDSIGAWAGTDEREKCRILTLPSADFRAGAIWHAHNQWPRIDATVDVAIFAPDGRLLLGRKPAEQQFRFIGGFAEPRTPNYEADVVREAKEETGLTLDEASIEYIGSMLIPDWRYRAEIDKIKTLFFRATSLSPPDDAVAGDDIAEVRWFTPATVLHDIDVVDTHKDLLKMLHRKGKLSCSTKTSSS